MKLYRFAMLTFHPPPQDWEEWALDSDGVHIQAELTQELESGDLQILVSASTNLEGRPDLDEDGFVIVPEGPLKKTEALIETSANLISVSGRCKRSISSPGPCAGFLPEDEETRAWLDSTNGIRRNHKTILSMGGFGIDPDTTLMLSSDRADGVALLSEALAHDHPTGRFHELLRVFERAFRLATTPLIAPLSEFLAGADLGYTEPEVRRWLTELRHPATHADREDHFVLESDIRPVESRMMQAAYDVLFNKVSWRDSSTDRRAFWRPPAGTSSEDRKPFITRKKAATLEFQLFDEVGSYPKNLEANISSILPERIWAKWETDKDPQ